MGEDMEAMEHMGMEAMDMVDIMARGLLMLNQAMDMDMVVMEDMVMDMEAMDIMDMVVMDTMDKKEKYRHEFHKQCDAKSFLTSYMKLIYKESSHEFIFLYLIINKLYSKKKKKSTRVDTTA